MKICFVAHFAYGALTGDPRGHVGGVERQTALMARWLADRGHEVSVTTWSEGPPGDEILDGIRILKICPANAGLPGVRFVHPRWTGLNAALARANADLYYQNCAEAITGQVALWARRHDRRFVYSVASDPECDATLPILGSIRERVLYRYGLKRAHAIITQTHHQQQMLQSGFGLTGTVLPMPSEVLSALPLAQLEAHRPARAEVLWIGRLAPVKDVGLYIDVARRLPEITFHLVGGADQDRDYAESMQARAGAVANMRVHGKLDRPAVLELIRSSGVLCCTSVYEGFPNTFLEAWAHGVPVVSTVDPDSLLTTHDLGRHARDAAGLAAHVQSLVNDPQTRSRLAHNAWRYYHTTHHLDSAMPRIEALLNQVTHN